VTAGELLAPVGWTLLVQLAAWEAGERLLARFVGAPDEGRALRATLSALVGFVLLANAVLLLALLRVLHAPLVAGAVIALAALGVRRLAGLAPWRGLRPSLADLPLGVALAFLLFRLPRALYPVIDHDDNVYHLLLPKHYLATHALDAPLFNLYGAMPHLIELLYVLPMTLGDYVAAKVFVFSIHFWMLLGLGACVQPRLGRLGVGAAALLLLSGQNVEWHLGRAYNEPVLGFFLLGAALAFVAFWQTRRTAWLAVVGLACGAACASKYTAWLFSAAVIAAVAFGIARLEPDPRRRLRALLLVVVPCAAIVLPWIARSLATTGNPVFPNLYGLFGGPHWSEVQALHHWRSLAINGGAQKDLGSYLLLPVRLVIDNRSFIAATFSGSLMAVFVAGLLHPRSYRGPGAPLQLMALGGLVAWAATIQSGRYLVALVPVITLAATRFLVPGRTLVAVAALALAVAAAQRALQPVVEPAGFEVFSRSRAELLERDPDFLIARLLNRNLPRDAKVLGVWYSRFFYLERPFEADPLYESSSVLTRLRELDDARAFARDLAARGFTHVVVGPGPGDAYFANQMPFDLLDERVYPARRHARDRALWRAFAARHLERLFQGGPVAVYRLRPT
jgi:hypothetical protein